MNQIQFETNGLTVLAHRVPSNATDIRFRFNRFLTYRMSFSSHVEVFDGKWKIHAVTDSITNTEANDLLDGKTWYENAVELLKDKFLRSHGIDPAEKWVLLVKQD